MGQRPDHKAAMHKIRSKQVHNQSANERQDIQRINGGRIKDLQGPGSRPKGYLYNLIKIGTFIL